VKQNNNDFDNFKQNKGDIYDFMPYVKKELIDYPLLSFYPATMIWLLLTGKYLAV